MYEVRSALQCNFAIHNTYTEYFLNRNQKGDFKMTKKIMSMILSIAMVLSIAVVVITGVSAADVPDKTSGVGAGNNIYFDVKKSGWNNVKTVYCHIWRADGTGDWPDWQTKKEKCKYDSSTGIATYDFSKTGHNIKKSDGKLYCVIFSANTGMQTYNVIMSGNCIGDTLYCTGNLLENPEDSEKRANEAVWAKTKDCGPEKKITSSGNVIGTTLSEGDTDASMLACFLVAYYDWPEKMDKVPALVKELNLSTSDVMKVVNKKLDNGGYDNAESIRASVKAVLDKIEASTPSISKLENTTGGIKLSWNKVSGAYGYRLYRKSYGSSWSRIVSTTDNSFVDTTAGKNTVIAYTLRCLDEKGNLISSYIDKTKYYRNGELANGTVTVNGKKLTFVKGVLRTGMQTINENKYYYNTSGVLQKNGIVGSDKDGWYYADKNGKIDFSYSNGITQNGKDWNVMSGKATRVKTKSDKTLFRALKVVAKVTNKSMSKSQKLKACFNYTKNAYKELNPRIPHYHGSDWPIIYANDMFVDGAGNCFSYGAAFAYMAKAIGYKNVYCCNSGGHGWAEVDGLVYDPEWSRHHARDYYALSYNTKLDQNYKAAIAAGYSWMHVKI